MSSSAIAYTPASRVSSHSSIFKRAWEGLSEGQVARARDHAVEAGMTLRQGAEGIAVGALLGAVHAEHATGLDNVIDKAPLDGSLAAAGMVGAIAAAGTGFAHDLRNLGTHAGCVFAFRKTHDAIAEKKAGSPMLAKGKIAKTGARMHGENGPDVGADEDPIVRAARGW